METNQTANESPANEKQPSRGARIVGVFRSVFIYVLSAALIVAALLFAADKSPQKSLFGYRYYVVKTPSMEPVLGVGDLILVKLTNAIDIEVGDIITFNPSSDGEAYLTHRVTEKLTDYEGTGVTCFKTKGDANEVEDGFLIDSSRVIGVEKVCIPKLGIVIRFIQLRWYIVITLVVLVFVFFKLLSYYFAESEEV
jgi:signal peptidase